MYRYFWAGLVFTLTAVLLVFSGGHALAVKGMLQGAHAQKSHLPKSCRSCHRGMTMALSGEETPCLKCHGSSSAAQKMAREGYLKDTQGLDLEDIEAELRKTYKHPVVSQRGVHQHFESLPEELVNAARHSECVDCHNPHLVAANNPFAGIKGRRIGNAITDVVEEYELCFRCHSESANLPGNSTDKHAEFKSTNPSFHPVMAEGKNTYVISLKEPYVAQKERPGEVSRITCGDCHGNDDPDGPKGPHGSNIPGLLVLTYQTEDARTESEYAYALCYKCHERASILSNESFSYHAMHIQGRVAGRDGTSCFTCHDAHGSSEYQHLIKFNEDVVSENAEGKLKYDSQGYAARHGSCSLSCHGVEHNSQEY